MTVGQAAEKAANPGSRNGPKLKWLQHDWCLKKASSLSRVAVAVLVFWVFLGFFSVSDKPHLDLEVSAWE